MFLVLLTSCAAQPQFYYVKNVKNFVKPLEQTKEFFVLKEWKKALKRQPIIQGHKNVNMDIVKFVQGHCNIYSFVRTSQFLTSEEFDIKGAGDCKNFAICKYYKLRAAGFTDNEINIWVGKYDGQDHMIVTVKADNKEIVMDIIDQSLPEAKNYFYKHFYPVYRFNEAGWDID